MAVVPYQNLSLFPRDTVFEGLVADKRVRKWASSDGSGSKAKMDWKQYQKAHMWFNADVPDKFGSYKFNIADISDGELKAVPRAIFAVAKSIQGARGGFVGINDGDLRLIKESLDRYYSKISGQEGKIILPPWNPKSDARMHGKRREKSVAAEIEALDLIVEKPELQKELAALDFAVLFEAPAKLADTP